MRNRTDEFRNKAWLAALKKGNTRVQDVAIYENEIDEGKSEVFITSTREGDTLYTRLALDNLEESNKDEMLAEVKKNEGLHFELYGRSWEGLDFIKKQTLNRLLYEVGGTKWILWDIPKEIAKKTWEKSYHDQKDTFKILQRTDIVSEYNRELEEKRAKETIAEGLKPMTSIFAEQAQ